MTVYIFTIPGQPFAKQRARSTRQGRMYTPQETVSYERQVGVIAAQHFPKPLEGPVKLTIRATFGTPQSWSPKKTAAKLHRPHIQRPDLDNIVKAISDGLNRIAFADDGQVCAVNASKVWGITPQVVVEIEAVAGA